MASTLVFRDADSAADALTFAQRAAPISDGLIRLRAEGGVLAITAAALAPTGLMDQAPTIVGMRVAAVDPELICDLVIEASGLAQTHTATELSLPESGTSAAWAGISPPRRGWIREGGIHAQQLAARAQWGIAEVAQTTPTSAGEDIVNAVRSRVWGASDPELSFQPRGVAFAAHAFGFVGGEETAGVFRSGSWVRVSLRRGHVLVRRTVREGLTAVRATGAG